MRAGLALLVALPMLAASGCGGTGGGGGVPAAGAPLPGGASIAPASAPVFVAVNTDLGSPEWKRDVVLLEKLPFERAALRMLLPNGVVGALGPETDAVWLDFRNNGNDVVGLTKPRSSAKLRALFGKAAGAPTFSRELVGWTVFASSRRLLDRFERERRKGNLAEDPEFKDAAGRLHPRAAVRLYLRGQPLQRALDRGVVSRGGPPLLSEEAATLVALAGDASAQPGGIRLGGIVTVKDAVRPNAYTAKLPEELPAGALLYISFNHLDLLLKRILKVVSEQDPTVEQQLSQLTAVLDITLSHDVYPLVSHEGAVAVYRGKRVPAVAVVLRLKDESRAKSVLGRLVTLAQISGGAVRTRGFDIGDARVTELDLPRSRTKLFAAVFNEELAVANEERTMRRLIEGGGRTLSDDPRFTRIQKTAKMPQRTLGFVYADLRDAAPAAFEPALGSVFAPFLRGTPFETALLYGTRAGDRYAVTGFLAIK